MDREEAKALLTDMAATSSRPVLGDATVNTTLDANAVVDADGRAPGDDGWAGVWDLNRAAAALWRIKAAKVAGDFNFSADGASYSKADVLAQCLEMETKYASLSHGLLQTLHGPSPLPRDWDGTMIP